LTDFGVSNCLDLALYTVMKKIILGLLLVSFWAVGYFTLSFTAWITIDLTLGVLANFFSLQYRAAVNNRNLAEQIKEDLSTHPWAEFVMVLSVVFGPFTAIIAMTNPLEIKSVPVSVD
jgi:hypothetical protein